MKEYQASVDASFSRAFARAEATLQDFEADNYVSSYAQAGYRITTALAVNAQVEWAQERDQVYADNYPSTFEWHRAGGLGVNYAFTPALVLKAEHHWNRGIQVEQTATPLAPPTFTYTIVSLSASF